MTTEFYTGGTDVMDRKRNRTLKGGVKDRRGEVTSGIVASASGAEIAAGTTVAALAADPRIAAGYAGLARAAGDLATPQIRNQATVGGNLAQTTRCRYFRHPHLDCVKKGGAACGGRDGIDENAVLFDLGGCAHPHASTLGMAFLAFDAAVMVNGKKKMSIADLYGDGAGGTRDNMLADGELITAVRLPAPVDGERSAYFRASARSLAEWAQCEVLVRIAAKGKKITSAAVAAGAVSQVPIRLTAVEQALIGAQADEAGLAAATELAVQNANPHRQAVYKATLLPRCIVACGLAAMKG